MTEFAVVSTVLVPMLVLMPSLSKTADLNLSTAQAARYGAWEQTLQSKDKDKLVHEISNRFYADSDLGIQTNRGGLTDDEVQNLYWGGAGLSKRMLSTGADTLALTVNSSSLGGAAGQVESQVRNLGKVLGVGSDSDWDLGWGNLYTVNVGTKLENENVFMADQNGSNCQGQKVENTSCLQFKSAILVNVWNAEGPQQVEERVRSLVPAAALAPVADTVSTIGKTLPLFNELGKLDGALGTVMPDVLPSDRYGNDQKRR